MRRMLMAVLAMFGILVAMPCVAFAAETEEPDVTLTTQSAAEDYYDPEMVDWDSVERIVVSQYNGDCAYIQDALERNINVTFMPGAMTRGSNMTYFASISWFYETSASGAGEWNLSLAPIDPVSLYAVEGEMDAAWNEAYSIFSDDMQYVSIANPSKYSSTYNQYVCHVEWPNALKTPWNLEPAKEDKGYWGFVLGGCN